MVQSGPEGRAGGDWAIIEKFRLKREHEFEPQELQGRALFSKGRTDSRTGLHSKERRLSQSHTTVPTGRRGGN